MLKSYLLSISLLITPFQVLANMPANDDIGKMSCGLKAQLPAFGDLASYIALFIGIVFVGVGLMKFKEHAHGHQPGAPNGPLKVAIIMIVAGGLLTSTATLSLVAGNTLFGTNTKLGQNGISGSSTASDDVLMQFTRDSNCR